MSTNRISKTHLQAIVDRINRTLGTPAIPYLPQPDGTYKSQAGCYFLEHSGAGWQLVQMYETSATRDVLQRGSMSARELSEHMHSWLRGIDAGIRYVHANNGARRDAMRQALQGKAWPGGYPLALLMADGECLCPTCIGTEAKLLLRAVRDDDAKNWPARDWLPVEAFINWEDPDLYCAHCGDRIKSAYAEPEDVPTDVNGKFIEGERPLP